MTPDLPSLAHRVSEATGPDRELDRALLVALALPAEFVGSTILSHFDSGDGSLGCNTADGWQHWSIAPIPPYTASIDAAVALFERLLPGWWWSVGRCQREVHCTAGPDRGHPLEGMVDAVQAFGATPALAVLAALFADLDALSPAEPGSGEKEGASS